MQTFRKTCATLAAVALTGSTLAAFPSSDVQQISADAVIVSNDFDISYEGWCSMGDMTELTADEQNPHGGSRSMLVSNRLSPEDGVSSAKGLYLWGGQKYDYKVFVKHESGNNENFKITLDYLLADETTWETAVLDEHTVSSGEWTEIGGSFRTPEGATEFIVKITTDTTCDFNFDDFTVRGNRYTDGTVSAADAGLKLAFGKYFRVGNIFNGMNVRNSALQGLALTNYNSIECENETKPDATLVQNGSTDTNIKVSLNSCASIFDFCAKNGIGVRGHTLVWHSQTPQWFFKEGFNNNGAWVNSSTMDKRMESYIKNMFNAIQTQYPTLDLYAYDVCNECISDDSNRTKNNGGARTPGYNNGNSPWVQVYGSNAFIEKAFTYARQYAPKSCKLYYNDYNEYWDHKRDCIYSTCKSLYDKGVLDGVGMQSHINADRNGFSGTQAYTTAMQKFLEIGCDVQVTELDISCENGKYSAQD
ncbi:MAG: endo-1,4-beta-xylanase, partial [Oscillospiraceae bacterium]|nr:endo-1,4-beta-xylanase [Oscillospiraceae bacterium]